MITHETRIRVRYGETDRMSYVYYGFYAQYFEVGRTGLIRELGVSYKEMEEEYGILMPVSEFHVNYKRPAYYDEILTIRSIVEEMPSTRLKIAHEVENRNGIVTAVGHVHLAFVDKSRMRPVRAPEFFNEILKKHWGSKLQSDI